jgi:hypothetical protein
VNGGNVFESIAQSEGLAIEDFYLTLNGKQLTNCDELITINEDNVFVQPFFRTLGGKGGFGSMLRAIGAQIEKTTNKEACRDLSGRRLRDVNAEKRIKDWIGKKAEREVADKKRKKEKLEKMKHEPKIMFKDPEYFKTRDEIPDQVDDALEYGLRQASGSGASAAAGSSSTKRSNDESGPSTSKRSRTLWLDVDGESDDSEDDHTEVIPELCVAEAVPEQVTQVVEVVEVVAEPEPVVPEIESTPIIEETPKTPPKAVEPEELDLNQFESEQQLVDLGLDRLKSALMYLKLKCGGTLEQRAERLWSVRGITADKIPKNLLAKK